MLPDRINSVMKPKQPFMRSKDDILEMINKLRTILKAHTDDKDSLRLHRQNVESQIRALLWVLGHNIPERYWCSWCDLSHEGYRCPKCGNMTIGQAEKELGEDIIEIENQKTLLTDRDEIILIPRSKDDAK